MMRNQCRQVQSAKCKEQSRRTVCFLQNGMLNMGVMLSAPSMNHFAFCDLRSHAVRAAKVMPHDTFFFDRIDHSTTGQKNVLWRVVLDSPT